MFQTINQMEYLPTKLGHYWDFYVGKYASTMFGIWDLQMTFPRDSHDLLTSGFSCSFSTPSKSWRPQEVALHAWRIGTCDFMVGYQGDLLAMNFWIS